MASPSTAIESPLLTHLPRHVAVFRCKQCSIELALQDELVSRSFSGSHGPAYLVRSTINTNVGSKASKVLLTGKHTIAPIACAGCNRELGWTYFTAPDQSQKYKEGKSILEKVRTGGD
ncbi:hypothetical protein OIO90_005245 [Microbotryomycetes sp. JL221]|nr:hypothetical protein OIO90_005245 [Microbotryomycetes sp. JL221]